MSFTNSILTIIGVLLILQSLTVNTKGFLNLFLLKVIPFFSGCFILYTVLASVGAI